MLLKIKQPIKFCFLEQAHFLWLADTAKHEHPGRCYVYLSTLEKKKTCGIIKEISPGLGEKDGDTSLQVKCSTKKEQWMWQRG